MANNSKVKRYNYVRGGDHMSRKRGKSKKRNVYENVIGWPEGTAIPSFLSDWLAYLLYRGIIDSVNNKLEDSEILIFRYNLGGFQIQRGIVSLFSSYYQYVVLQKVGERGNGSMNVWVDGKFTSIIRNGNAYGKYIFARHYDRNEYVVSRILATKEEDYKLAEKLFPNTPHRWYIQNEEE